jgi:hypothetical protein
MVDTTSRFSSIFNSRDKQTKRSLTSAYKQMRMQMSTFASRLSTPVASRDALHAYCWLEKRSKKNSLGNEYLKEKHRIKQVNIPGLRIAISYVTLEATWPELKVERCALPVTR